jgi:hypothetical protein
MSCSRFPRPSRKHAYDGAVAASSANSSRIASSRCAPHMSGAGRSEAQTAGRSGLPKSRQRSRASSCTQGTPAGLPCGMPGIGELIEGAMQHAAQASRQRTAAQSAVASAAWRARSSAWISSVDGRTPCQSAKLSAACSTSMPSPSIASRTPLARAQARNGIAASP